MLVEFEQNRMVQTTRKFELFDKKRVFKNLFWQSVDAILEHVSVTKTIFNAKLLISRLLSFSVPKITVVWHVELGQNVAPNMVDPISLYEKDRSRKYQCNRWKLASQNCQSVLCNIVQLERFSGFAVLGFRGL